MAIDIPARIGAYDVLGLIGAGSLGTVFKASKPTSNRLVAIKVLSPAGRRDAQCVERFHRGAQAMAPLSHPNIVQVLDHWVDSELPYIVMEYVDGTSLAERIRTSGLSPAEALFVGGEIAKGLSYAHGRGIVHRDLNPQNVLVSRDLSMVKITDFSMGRAPAPQASSGDVTTAHASLGSFCYTAPEAMAGGEAVDHRADIYSLGVVCYEALTGKLPVGRFSLPSELNHDAPEEVDPIVLKCLASNPKDRYESVAAFLADLARVDESVGFQLARELTRLSPARLLGGARSKVTSSAPGSRSNVRLLWAGVALVALAAAVGGAWWWRTRPAVQNASPGATSLAAPAQSAQRAVQPVASDTRRDGASTPEPPATATPPVAMPPAQATPPSKTPPEGRVTGGAARPQEAPAPAKGPVAAGSPAPTATDATRVETARQALAAIEVGMNRRPRPQTIADLKAWLSQYGATSVAPDALLLCGRLQAESGLPHDAIETYHEVESRFPADVRAADALFAQAQLLAEIRANPEEIRLRLARIATAYPTSQVFGAAMTAKIALEDRLKLREADPVLGMQVPASLVSRRTLVAQAPPGPLVEGALAQLAEMYQDLKLWDRAAQTYVDLARRFPGNKRDAWFAAGEIYERRLSSAERARAAYLQTNPASPRYKTAMDRARRLEGKRP